MKYAIKILKQELKELKAEIKSDEDYISDVPEDEKHLYKDTLRKFKYIIDGKKEKVSELKRAISKLKK